MKGSRDKGRKSSRREILQFEICNPRFVIRRRRWEVPMKQTSNLLLTLVFVLAGVTLALAETTLEKIARTGTLAIGTRTGSDLEVPMKQTSNLLLTLVFVLAGVTLALAETTLEKIARTGTLAIGTRTG